MLSSSSLDHYFQASWQWTPGPSRLEGRKANPGCCPPRCQNSNHWLLGLLFLETLLCRLNRSKVLSPISRYLMWLYSQRYWWLSKNSYRSDPPPDTAWFLPKWDCHCNSIDKTTWLVAHTKYQGCISHNNLLVIHKNQEVG